MWEWLGKLFGGSNDARATEQPAVETKEVKTSERKYNGSTHSKRTMSFPVNNLSPNKDVGMSAELLRQRARYLAQNTPLIKRALHSIANGAIGTGILPTFTHPNKKIEAEFKRLWAECMDTSAIDFNGRLEFVGLSWLVAMTYKRDGEVLILRRRVPVSEHKMGIQLQVLEMEYLATFKNIQVMDGGGWTMNGIQYDKRGKAEAYWLFSRHPSEWYTQPTLVPVEDIIHVLDVIYPAQNRGVTEAAPVIITTQDLDEFNDADLMSKKISAAHAMFITENDQDGDKEPDDDEDYLESGERVQPGTVYHLKPGEQITGNTPPVSPGMDGFRKSMHMNIATGMGVTYEQLTGDYGNVNFSSYKAGWIEQKKMITAMQLFTLIPQFHKRVMSWFLEQVPLIPGSRITQVDDKLSVKWTTPRSEMLDVPKEMKGVVMMLQAGLISWEEAAQQFGRNPDELLEMIKKNKEDFVNAGVNSNWLQNLDLSLLLKKQKDSNA